MEQLLNRNLNEILENGKISVIKINGCQLLVFEDGTIYCRLKTANFQHV